jgi:hypothetical protein
MTDTPETKAFKTRIRGIDGDKHWVPALFAERLERERDEAIDAMKTCRRVSREDCEQNAKRAEKLHVQNLTLERERDEAMEVLQEIANASHFDNIGNFARNKAREALKIKQ